jgi:hypothetical protein
MPPADSFRHPEIDEDATQPVYFKTHTPKANGGDATRYMQLEANRSHWASPTARASPSSAYASSRRMQWSDKGNRERYIARDQAPESSRTGSDDFALPSTPQSELILASGTVLDAAKHNLSTYLKIMHELPADHVARILEETIRDTVEKQNYTSGRQQLTEEEVLIATSKALDDLIETFDDNLSPDRVLARRKTASELATTYETDPRRIFRKSGPAGEEAYGKFLEASYANTLGIATAVRGKGVGRYATKINGWDYDTQTQRVLTAMRAGLDALLQKRHAASVALAGTGARYGRAMMMTGRRF